MKNKVLLVISISLVMIVLAACGTEATPAWEAAQETEQPESVVENTETEAVEEEPTVEPTIAPTDTPEPPTSTPEPTEEVTEEPTEAAAAPSDPLVRQVQFSNAEHGEELFNTEFDTASGPWKCVTCHSIEADVVLTGPSQHGLPERAATRVDGEVAERYIYTSILHPSEYVVEDFPDGVMPQNYEEIFSEQDVLDLIAYLMTLNAE